MIRAALQRPGRLRMRLTVVAAASALFALVVLAALVLPSLQRNLEQSRVASLRANVLAFQPSSLLGFGRQLNSETLQQVAGTLGVGRVSVYAIKGIELQPMADSSTAELQGADLVEESAALLRALYPIHLDRRRAR